MEAMQSKVSALEDKVEALEAAATAKAAAKEQSAFQLIISSSHTNGAA